jgi:hypothetical protein
MEAGPGRSVAAAHCPIHVALRVACHLGLSLVVEVLALCDADIHLCAAILQPHTQGNDRKTLPLDCFAQIDDLPLVDQELPGPIRIVICICSVRIRIDMCSDEPQFPIINAHVSLADGYLAIADGFDLGAGERYSSLNGLFNEIVVKGAPILTHYPIAAWRVSIRTCVFLGHKQHYRVRVVPPSNRTPTKAEFRRLVPDWIRIDG